MVTINIDYHLGTDIYSNPHYSFNWSSPRNNVGYYKYYDDQDPAVPVSWRQSWDLDVKILGAHMD